MLVNANTAAYLVNVGIAVNNGTVPSHYLTDVCPECGDTQFMIDHGQDHIITVTPSGALAVVIGCEGFWVINPNEVGMGNDMWQDWTTAE